MGLYLDTSALVKLFIQEEGSEELVLVASLESVLATSIATAAEMPAALARAVRIGRLQLAEAETALASFRHAWPDYFAVELRDSVTHQAGELAWRLGLRGYDAVHLASGLVAADLLGDTLVFAVYDHTLWRAAQRQGMNVYPPELGEAAPPQG